MKNLVLVATVFCCLQIVAQRKPKIRGNKSVVEVSESLPAFNAIELNDDLEINLKKANQEGFMLTIDDNLVDVLKFKVVDSTLLISSFYKITSKKKLDITINYFEISSIIVREGRIKMGEVLEADELLIKTYGSAKVQLNSNTKRTTLIMEGNSSGDLSLASDSLNIILKDRVDVKVYGTSQQSKIQMDSNSSLTMEGTAYALSAALFDKASLKARKLDSEGVEVISEGSPSAYVYASKYFELNSRGSSKTYLSGDAKIDILEFLDTSELHKEK